MTFDLCQESWCHDFSMTGPAAAEENVTERCARERIHSWLSEHVAGRPEAAKATSTMIEDRLAVFDRGGLVEADSIEAQDRKLAPIAKRHTETIGDVTRHRHGTTLPPRAWDHLVPHRAGRP